jgi:hypothetical protein
MVMFPLKLLLRAQQFDVTTLIDLHVCPVFGNTNEISYIHKVLHKLLTIPLK